MGVDGYEVRFTVPGQGVVYSFPPVAGAVPKAIAKLEGKTLAECVDLRGRIGDAARDEMAKHARPRRPNVITPRLDRPNAVLEVLHVTTTE